MALRECPECTRDYCTNATHCPHCGFVDHRFSGPDEIESPKPRSSIRLFAEGVAWVVMWPTAIIGAILVVFAAYTLIKRAL